MTTPSSPAVDPRLVTALSDECESIGRQLRHLGQNLSILQTQLTTMRPAAPAQVPAYVPQPIQYPVPQYVAPQPQSVRPTSPPKQPSAPWWQRDGMISRLLAIAGVAVTLIGVVMLLVLAAQAGFFGPPLRVIGGAALSGALIFAGFRVYGRPGGRVGAIALAATGFAGLYLDVMAASVLYGWIVSPLSMVIAFGIAAAGVAVAVRWNSESLTLLIVLGAALAAPALAGALTLPLIGFLVALQVAGISAQLGRDWKYLGLARTAPVVLVLIAAIVGVSLFDGMQVDSPALTFSAVLVSVIGLSAAVALQWKGSPSRDGVAGAWSSATFIVAVLPLLGVGVLLSDRMASLLYGVTALVLLSGAAAGTALSTHLRMSVAGVGAVALLLSCVAGSPQSLTAAVLLAIATIFIGVAGSTGSRFVCALGSGFAVIGWIGFLESAAPSMLMTSRAASAHLDALTALTSLTAIGVLVAFVLATRRLKLVSENNIAATWAISGMGILYAATCALVASGIEIWGGTTGFVFGHSAATVVWMLAATSALVFGLNNREYAHTMLGTGLTLTCAALAKLFLFDLATLSGLVRGVAFLVVGLLLLLVGTRYARAFGKQDQINSASAAR
ncbi:DUF2339 domain-containing protein [Rhodococcus sp. NPDC056743]|uniref:DUF2339 domain-containing protein n=1 Tax=Rhodococcus sp. NPDC056743 TaxID=3345934 RepID=UPI00366CA448